MKKSTYDKLCGNAFMRELGSKSFECIQARLKKENSGETASNKDLEIEKYVSSIFGLTFKIQSTFETICTIPNYLANLPTKSIQKRYDIEKTHYYKYHIENHIIRSTTIFDQLILLINGLFELGIDPKKCTFDIISTNSHTKKSREIALLKELDKAINGFKGKRNLILHRGEFRDSDFDDIATRELLKKNFNENEKKDIAVEIYLKNEELLSKIYRSERISEMKKSNENLCNFLLLFFEEARKTFNQKLKNKE
ncbi:MAG: hypothetical protein JNL75_04670 [Chitinophagales bacterium]|nr:hypothetical protein [Chitinophagales bacterium]